MSMPETAVHVEALACPAWCAGRHEEFPGCHDSAPYGEVWLTRNDRLIVTRGGALTVELGPVCVRLVAEIVPVDVLLTDLPTALAAVAEMPA